MKSRWNALAIPATSQSFAPSSTIPRPCTRSAPALRGYDSGLDKLEELIKTKEIVFNEEEGRVIDFDVKEEYLDFQKKYLTDISNLKIAIDCSNGMASLLIKQLMGNHPIYLFDEMDGTFPNHEANPLEPENIVALQELVKETESDIGVIFDGDADRVMFVDENSKFISPDLMIALLAHYFLEEKGEMGNVLQDIRSSKAVGEYINKFGSEMTTWKVGRANAALKLREIDGIYGGELAGHYYFKDFYYSDSGLMACSIVLGIISKMKKQGKTVSELIASISKYENSGELNYRIEKKLDAMNAVKDYFTKDEKVLASYDFDGYRVEFEDWWFNIRQSNTEPYLRFIAEAKNKELLKEKITAVNEILNTFK